MGKRKKKVQNVIKVDLGDFKSEPLPVLVQHLSKDGRRIAQTIHRLPPLPTVHEFPPLPTSPPSLTFDPCPVVAEDEDTVFPDTESPRGENGGEHVRPHFSPHFSVPDEHVGCRGIHFGLGFQNAIFGFKT